MRVPTAEFRRTRIRPEARTSAPCRLGAPPPAPPQRNPFFGEPTVPTPPAGTPRNAPDRAMGPPVSENGPHHPALRPTSRQPAVPNPGGQQSSGSRPEGHGSESYPRNQFPLHRNDLNRWPSAAYFLLGAYSPIPESWVALVALPNFRQTIWPLPRLTGSGSRDRKRGSATSPVGDLTFREDSILPVCGWRL